MKIQRMTKVMVIYAEGRTHVRTKWVQGCKLGIRVDVKKYVRLRLSYVQFMMLLCPSQIDINHTFFSIFPHFFHRSFSVLPCLQKSPPFASEKCIHSHFLFTRNLWTNLVLVPRWKKQTIALHSSVSLGIFVLSQRNYCYRLFKCMRQLHC